MPADFEWYTEEEPSSEPLREERPGVVQGFSVRKAAWTAVAFAVVALAAYLLVRNRLEAAETEVRREIVASYVVVEDAIAGSDPDLLVSVLSGRDSSWSATQRDLVARGMLNDYPSLGLDGTQAEAADVDLELAPDLRSAELTAAFSFEIQDLTGLTETVALSRTLTFRRGSDRWLYAPPDDVFWGDMETSHGNRLTISYPERDATTADRLGVLLERRIEQLCRDMPEMGCPDDMHLYLTLDSDPEALVTLANYGRVITGLKDANFSAPARAQNEPAATAAGPERLWGWQLTLPAPSLIGEPSDEPAAAAILRGYASLAVGALITKLNGWECCAQGLLYRALLDYQLGRLDLAPWGLSADEYELLLQRRLPLHQTRDLWLDTDVGAADPLRRATAHALVEFALAHGKGTTATGLQQSLTGAGTLNSWLSRVIPDLDSEASLQQAWLRYIYERSRSRALAAQLPVPAQDLLLACGEPDAAAGRLLRLDPAAEAWHDLGVDGPFDNLTAIGDGLVAMNFSGTDPLSGFGQGTAVWDAGELRVVHEDGNIFVLLEGAHLFSLPAGRLLVVAEDGDQAGGFVPPQFYQLDARDCRWPDCPLTPLDGLPFASPDGRRRLVMTLDTEDEQWGRLPLKLIDENGAATEIGRGMWPFWLDDSRYGFISPDNGIVLATVSDREPRPALDPAALQAVLPADPTATGLEIVWARALQPQVGRALLYVTDTVSVNSLGRQRTHVVIFEPGQAPRLALSLEPPAGPSWPIISPDGRWVAIHSGELAVAAGVPASSTYVIATEGDRPPIVLSNTNPDFWAPQFSADGEWLALAQQDFLDLVYLGAAARGGEPMHRFIFHDLGSCHKAAWIER
jgi:hypothetical protein